MNHAHVIDDSNLINADVSLLFRLWPLLHSHWWSISTSNLMLLLDICIPLAELKDLEG